MPLWRAASSWDRCTACRSRSRTRSARKASSPRPGHSGRAAFVPARDATAVARLRAAGGILLGKTNCTELCGSGETDNLVYGRTNNPYDLSRSPGGSSGGEAAIIAAGGSPLGLASDFGGSIRGPAHLCGIAGLNPTFGRVPRTGHIPPYGGAYDTARIGPMARYVEDLALVLPIIAGPDGIDPTVAPVPVGDPNTVTVRGLRVAFHTDNGIFPVTHETAETVRNAARALADAGLSVTEDCPPGLSDLMEVGAALGSISATGRARRGLSGVQRTCGVGIRGVHAVRRSLDPAVAAHERRWFHDGCRVAGVDAEVGCLPKRAAGFHGAIRCDPLPSRSPPGAPARGDDAAGLPGLWRDGVHQAVQHGRLAVGGGPGGNVARRHADRGAGGSRAMARACRADGGASHRRQAWSGEIALRDRTMVPQDEQNPSNVSDDLTGFPSR